METVGRYLIGVTAAALLCALVGKLDLTGTAGAMLRLVCALVMALAVVSPWKTFQWNPDLNWIGDAQAQGEALAVQGENSAREAMTAGITGQVRTYILDKAAQLGLELEVEVFLSEDLRPVAVTLRGQVSPYSKGVLESYILENLGIEKGAQKWIT